MIRRFAVTTLGGAVTAMKLVGVSINLGNILMTRIRLYTVPFVLFFVAGGAQAEGDVEAGKQKAEPCAACHGPDGNSVMEEWPKLAGQNPRYLETQLAAFKSGGRSDPSMTSIAEPLSDEDIADLAAYFASHGIAVGETDPALMEQGEAIYRGGKADAGVPACMGCHGPNGAGNSAAGYPALGGQHAKYTQKQLMAYKSGERTTDTSAVMRMISERLSDEETQAVASYIVGLH